MGEIYDSFSAGIRAIYRWRIRSPAILDERLWFPGAVRFAAAWREIRAEIMPIVAEGKRTPLFHELMPEQAEISANDGLEWRVLPLKLYTVELAANLARLPLLHSLLVQTPEVITAIVSVLAPKKHVPLHCGPFRGILRYHLGLSVPNDDGGEPGTVMTIDGERYTLRDGKSLLWDDTYPHEVSNNANQPRVALLLDVWRPGMPLDMELLSRVIVRFAKRAVIRRRMTEIVSGSTN